MIDYEKINIAIEQLSIAARRTALSLQQLNECMDSIQGAKFQRVRYYDRDEFNAYDDEIRDYLGDDDLYPTYLQY